VADENHLHGNPCRWCRHQEFDLELGRTASSSLILSAMPTFEKVHM